LIFLRGFEATASIERGAELYQRKVRVRREAGEGLRGARAVMHATTAPGILGNCKRWLLSVRALFVSVFGAVADRIGVLMLIWPTGSLSCRSMATCCALNAAVGGPCIEPLVWPNQCEATTSAFRRNMVMLSVFSKSDLSHSRLLVLHST
jgi:hypothetical protein